MGFDTRTFIGHWGRFAVALAAIGVAVPSLGQDGHSTGARSINEQASPTPVVAFDLQFTHSGVNSFCTSTQVAKEEVPSARCGNLEGGSNCCATAILTAGHCVLTDGRPFDQVKVQLDNRGLGHDFIIKYRADRLLYNFDNQTMSDGYVKPQHDRALIRADVPCAWVEKLPVSTLHSGEFPKQQDTLSLLGLMNSDSPELNPGGGRTMHGKLGLQETGGYQYQLNMNEGNEPNVGDSGGPIVDSKGRVLSVFSTAPAKGKRDHALFDPEVAGWARANLKKWGFKSHGGTPATPATPAKEPASTTYQMAGATYTPPVADAKLPYSSMVDYYENKMHYLSGNKRYRHPKGTFRDVPVGGTGKIIIATYGNVSQMTVKRYSDLIEIRTYPTNSPEAAEMRFWGVGALGIDGLGRKISRYDSVNQGLNSVQSEMDGVGASEVELLRRYLASKANQRELYARQHPQTAPQVAQAATAPQATPRSALATTAPVAMPTAPSPAAVAQPLPTFAAAGPGANVPVAPMASGKPADPDSVAQVVSTAPTARASRATIPEFAPEPPPAATTITAPELSDSWVGYLSEKKLPRAERFEPLLATGAPTPTAPAAHTAPEATPVAVAPTPVAVTPPVSTGAGVPVAPGAGPDYRITPITIAPARTPATAAAPIAATPAPQAVSQTAPLTVEQAAAQITGRPAGSPPASFASRMRAQASPVSASHPPLSTNFNPANLGSFIQSSCVKCHQGGAGTKFPAFVTNWSEWERKLDAGDHEARTWLEMFNSKVVHGEMLAQSNLDKRSGAGKDFHDFVAGNYQRYLAEAPSQFSLAGVGGPNASMGSRYATRLIDPAKAQAYDNVLRGANIDDPKFAKAIKEFDLMWDETGNPTWSWAPHGGDSGRKGARPLRFTNPSSVVAPYLFTGRMWREPLANGFAIGPDTKGLSRFSLVRFPRDSAGQIIKGVRGKEWHSNQRAGRNGAWGNGDSNPAERGDLETPWASFPNGTMVFEVIYATVDGKHVPVDIVSFEKRVTADGSVAQMIPNSLRADSSPDKIRAWVAAQTDQNPDYARILEAVNNPVRDSIDSELGARYQDGSYAGGTPFIVNNQFTKSIPATKSIVRGVSQQTLARMYSELPMESASGLKGWQLEPENVFSGSHRGIAVNTQSCKNCHRFAGEPFRDIFTQAGLENSQVYAYGDGPGYDGVLGAPWFSPEALNLYSNKQYTFQMRKELAPFFEDYDPRRHSATQYRRNDDGPLTNNPLRNPASAR